MNIVRHDTQPFHYPTVQQDTVGQIVGYWVAEMTIRGGRYFISITREDKDNRYTVASLIRRAHEDKTEVRVIGHPTGLQAAVDMANALAKELQLQAVAD